MCTRWSAMLGNVYVVIPPGKQIPWVFGAKLRTVMSSIIRWRKAETLRTVGMGYPNEVVLLMVSNGIGKLLRKKGW